ncbi:GatB/YqeY domain-containing protein [Aquirufa antheringensis]|uniref:GatB/YqeY domain-containing protein n=1 Tax=Aquirufa antheringensis TaxID=2516559 RepID=UPI001032CD83|nr:GatB/YqeY domain-containing protein [Aquirufa antheringensis]MCE4217648.1 GatB/YqeY domain-containing protein [Pseudarcicella sp. GAP-15]TBH71803.1 GatB/YqeY domain-containing protein [Aquirufa antheringensis]
MSLKITIENGIKDAMRAKDADRLRALRAIKSMILLEETSGSSGDGLSADAEMKILMKAAKQRRDSLEVYVAQNRPDLAEKEQAELAIIEEFLPKQLSDAELTAKITEIIAAVGATSPADMGKVMGAASKQLAGLADGKAISAKVSELLKK